MTETKIEEDIFDLSNKTLLITGACGTLGKSYCKEFAKRGATLCITDICDSSLNSLLSEIESISNRSHFAQVCDLESEGDIKRLFNRMNGSFEKLDGVLNNAAATGEHLLREGDVFAKFEDYPLLLWEKILRINLTGAFLIAREASKLLLKSPRGSLVNVSSVYGVRGPDHRIYEDMNFSSFVPYSASKSGVHGLTLWLATYWATTGVRVNTLVPGGVENNHSPEFVSRYSNRTPIGRMACPEDMLGAATFLMSDASRYLTGQQIVVDGGLSCW